MRILYYKGFLIALPPKPLTRFAPFTLFLIYPIRYRLFIASAINLLRSPLALPFQGFGKRSFSFSRVPTWRGASFKALSLAPGFSRLPGYVQASLFLPLGHLALAPPVPVQKWYFPYSVSDSSVLLFLLIAWIPFRSSLWQWHPHVEEALSKASLHLYGRRHYPPSLVPS